MPAIDINLLKAAATVCGKEETRYYLNGVCVDVRVDDITCVATDGHRIAAFNDKATWDEGEEPTPFVIIIPSEIVAEIKLFKPVPYGTITPAADGKYLLQYCGRDYLFRPLDASFPDWRRIIPGEVDGKTAQFNPKYLADFGKISKALGDKEGRVYVYHNGGSPAPVYFPGVEGVSYVCAVMPYRLSAPEYERPAWTK